MSTPLSPYLNPRWADAVWDVSGAFANDRELVAFFDFCKLLLDFEPYHLVHGAPLCAWNSGRVLRHMMREAMEIRNAWLDYEQRGIAVYLTLTNLVLGEEHLKDPLGNALCEFSAKHNKTGRNAVIVGSQLLSDHIRKEYPTLRQVSSILRITADRGKGKLDAYRRLAEQYDEVMMHPDDVLNYDMLEQLGDKERYILLVNEYCIRNCPLRGLHYDSLSHTALDFLSYDTAEFDAKQANNGCRSLYTLLTDERRGVLALDTPEIQRLRDMGFRHFKLQGRGHANAMAILTDLLRLVLRQDEAGENAMHAVGQRFWESILPIKA